MRDGAEEFVNIVKMCRGVSVLVKVQIGIVMVERVRNEVIQLGEEMMVNFATAENVIRVARHTAGMIIAHPLQVVWIVTASFKAPGVPGPKALALGAKHLVTSLGLVNGNLAIGARFSVVLQESDRGNRVGVANV